MVRWVLDLVRPWLKVISDSGLYLILQTIYDYIGNLIINLSLVTDPHFIAVLLCGWWVLDLVRPWLEVLSDSGLYLHHPRITGTLSVCRYVILWSRAGNIVLTENTGSSNVNSTSIIPQEQSRACMYVCMYAMVLQTTLPSTSHFAQT